jgi:hypothetical protein
MVYINESTVVSYKKCLLYKTAYNIGWIEKYVYVYTALIFRTRRSWFMLIAYIHWFEKNNLFSAGFVCTKQHDDRCLIACLKM